MQIRKEFKEFTGQLDDQTLQALQVG